MKDCEGRTIVNYTDMVQTQQTSAVVLNNMTITRANVIAQRTGSLEMGLAKAMLIEQLKEKLSGSFYISETRWGFEGNVRHHKSCSL